MREGGHTMSISAGEVFFRVRIRGERLREARGNTVGDVRLLLETEGDIAYTFHVVSRGRVLWCRAIAVKKDLKYIQGGVEGGVIISSGCRH